MRASRRFIIIALLAPTLLLAACGRQEGEVEPTLAPANTPTAQPTPLPEIHIVDRERLVIGVDSAFPPFIDLDADGEPVGLEVDLLAALAEVADLDYELVSSGWDTLFLDLVAGRFDAVLGAITPADAPSGLVELTEPYFEVGQVAVVLAGNEELAEQGDLSRAVVGVQPLSWGEFVVSGDPALVHAGQSLSVANIRRYDTPEQLIEALIAGQVGAVVTHHTVVDSYLSVNPDDLFILPAGPRTGETAGSDRDAWLATRSFHVAVPRGANELLAVLNRAIQTLHENGRMEELVHSWGFAPVFAERPEFVQDASASCLVAGIEKLDDYAVRFVLNRPDPFFDYKMAIPALAIHSPENLRRFDGGGELALNPIGTGPYMWAEGMPGQVITLTANINYWGGRPQVDTVVIQPVPDAAERYALLKAGRVQLMDNLGRSDLEALEEEEDETIAVYERTPINIAYLGMNRDIAPFTDRSVRQAVAHCIDQGDLVESIYPSGTLIATQFLPSNTFGFTPGLLWHEHNTDLAASLLATAGYTSGLTVTLSLADTPTDYLPEPRQIAEAIQLQLAECSITVDIELLDSDTYADASVDGQFGLFLSGWSADYPGPIGFLNYHFGGAGGDRQFGSPFPEIAERLEQAARTTDRALRQELYDQVNELLKEKVIFTPLAHGSSTLIALADLPGVVTNPVRRESLALVGPITGTTAMTTLVYAVSSHALSLDPTDQVDDATFAVTNQLFDTLVGFEPATTVLTPALAIEWSVNEANDVWDFTLRRGVRFHDQTEFNADTVILNFERLWDPEHPLHGDRAGVFRYSQWIFGAFRESQ